MNQALYDTKDNGGFLRFRDMQRNSKANQTPFFCESVKTQLKDCQRYEGKNALNLGIITSEKLEQVTLPQNLIPASTFFGRSLNGGKPIDTEALRERLGKKCDGQSECLSKVESQVNNYLGEPFGAFAIGLEKTGYGFKFGADTDFRAALNALYRCNHTKDNNKLCELIAIDQKDVGWIYEENKTLSSTLLNSLPNVSPEVMTNELRDFQGDTNVSRYKFGNDYTGITPKSLEGIQGINTQELVTLLRERKPAKIVDVGWVGKMLPGSLNFINAGLAFSDEKFEAAFDERFKNMLQIAADNRDTPIIFYGPGANSWLAVNAALRAKRAGYKNVIWYRGGLEAWVTAGLPLISRAPVAVID
jgi:rhodanese-related sulfurtransferase